ncbi:hypothetical protein NDU88_000789 [Pleurodeles waltl]|uniref:Uncharacterized protein n=1 Tax=Pleurodeles waltl TaxID=8319 RepID=A0AAV7WLP7_PLEWA|nr:hypothetical protein NDU88_000789 [Pleurodeles waltl]
MRCLNIEDRLVLSLRPRALTHVRHRPAPRWAERKSEALLLLLLRTDIVAPLQNRPPVAKPASTAAKPAPTLPGSQGNAQCPVRPVRPWFQRSVASLHMRTNNSYHRHLVLP